MTRCKPGDLAVVIEGVNAGAFVDVLRREDSVVSRVAWVCRARSAIAADVIDMMTGLRILEQFVQPGDEVCFFDVDLQPIRPAPKQATMPDREVTA